MQHWSCSSPWRLFYLTKFRECRLPLHLLQCPESRSAVLWCQLARKLKEWRYGVLLVPWKLANSNSLHFLHPFLSKRLMYYIITELCLCESARMKPEESSSIVISEFRWSVIFSLCVCLRKTTEQKRWWHRNIILKINVLVTSRFSLPLKHSHWPFPHPIPGVWAHLFLCSFMNF